jgi:hypothetical protein
MRLSNQAKTVQDQEAREAFEGDILANPDLGGKYEVAVFGRYETLTSDDNEQQYMATPKLLSMISKSGRSCDGRQFKLDVLEREIDRLTFE